MLSELSSVRYRGMCRQLQCRLRHGTIAPSIKSSISKCSHVPSCSYCCCLLQSQAPVAKSVAKHNHTNRLPCQAHLNVFFVQLKDLDTQIGWGWHQSNFIVHTLIYLLFGSIKPAKSKIATHMQWNSSNTSPYKSNTCTHRGLQVAVLGRHHQMLNSEFWKKN